MSSVDEDQKKQNISASAPDLSSMTGPIVRRGRLAPLINPVSVANDGNLQAFRFVVPLSLHMPQRSGSLPGQGMRKIKLARKV